MTVFGNAMIPMYELWIFESDMIYETPTHECVVYMKCDCTDIRM